MSTSSNVLMVFFFCLFSLTVEGQVVKGQHIIGGSGNLRISLQNDAYNIGIRPYYAKVFNGNVALGGTLRGGVSVFRNEFRSRVIGIGPIIKYFVPFQGKDGKHWFALHTEAVYSTSSSEFMGNDRSDEFVEFSVGPQYYYFINSKVAFELSALYYYTDNVPSFRDNQQDLTILFGLSVFL